MVSLQNVKTYLFDIFLYYVFKNPNQPKQLPYPKPKVKKPNATYLNYT